MTKTVLKGLALAAALTPAIGLAQAPKSATYITDEEVKAVNATPGVDRTIKVVDIGPENFAVGVIHRGATGGGGARGAAPAGGAGAAGGAARRRRGAAAAAPPEPCGEQSTAPATGGAPGMIAHDQQTEGYLIISGGGTLVTGGKIVNGRKSAPESTVTKELNGPSCSGTDGRRRHRAEGGQDRRHHHHPGRRAARLDRYRRPRRLSELPSVGARARPRATHTRRSRSRVRGFRDYGSG